MKVMKMQIKVRNDMKVPAAACIEQAVFDALRKGTLDIQFISYTCDLYTSLCGLQLDDKVPCTVVDIPDKYADQLASMLEASLPDQLMNSPNADMTWIIQMMSLIKQLRAKEDGNKVAEKGYLKATEKEPEEPERDEQEEEQEEEEQSYDDFMR